MPSRPAPPLLALGLLGLALAVGCAPLAPRPSLEPTGRGSRAAPRPPAWAPGQPLMQGVIGASYLSDFRVDPSGSPPIELTEDEYEVLPVLGGGYQWKLAGQRIDFGLEAFVSFSGRSDLEAFASSGGSGVVVFDVDLLLLELYGGPFVSQFLGDGLRLYGAAGPLLQWASYDQSDGTDDDSADGSGGGVYARAGLEFLLPSRKLVGFGARWSESSLDFDSGFGDLDLGGVQVFVSYSYGLEPRSAFDEHRFGGL